MSVQLGRLLPSLPRLPRTLHTATPANSSTASDSSARARADWLKTETSTAPRRVPLAQYSTCGANKRGG
jgi:hypothetical protein